MPNERLRAALLERGVSASQLAEALRVDHKTVERWVNGRLPYRRHRFSIASYLGFDEVYLWPDALSRDQVASASESEIIAVWPHRSEVPMESWRRLFEGAEHEIGVLVYAGIFLSEDAPLQRILMEKAASGVAVRFLVGQPDSEQVAQRSHDEGLDGSMEMKIRGALVNYRPLRQTVNVEFRFHSTPLYNSIYLADDQLFVNTHVFGIPAAKAPMWHLRKVAGGELATIFAASFERVWETGNPLPED
ncbi:helix-turn-helix domain-containing protein [Tenggerimyces flavus]|uniref:Helix-turn-helix domain-containing protein n=1 Tax=Tenggerimyces flavus TaxID=1708749 RepID=A0ABV7YPB1_9ACTN|nr:helix-turn-helix transcriptional regulator [Tenggerimyces flavus]MBM7786498.1 transcriptional regulator with XRE-family HTH domain [Tenggerimyces flavus]